jgi:beta-xylosidase
MNTQRSLGPWLIVLFALLVANRIGFADPPSPWVNWTTWGDQGDGTYINPVIPTDFSDIDAIRVGDDYYAISSTFQFSPGVVILHSKDLVNWSILGHAVDDVTQISPEMGWQKMDRYGSGIWAGAIRYHANKFWIYFGTPNEGYFMTTAPTPAGPWEPLHPVLQSPGWDDCCPFWDDNGQGYLIGSRFAADPVDGKRYHIHLFKLSADGRDLLPSSDQTLYQANGSEANKLYKINGLYYHLFSEVHKGDGRVVMMRRAKSLSGPWEIHQLNHGGDREPNQGGLVETPNGKWYFFTHHGTGSWEGRVDSLLSVTWIDGWPIIGTVGPDGIGTMEPRGAKPINVTPIATLQVDAADFSPPTLPPQFEWNYQPRSEKWSLTQRPGFLRLHAFKPLVKDKLQKVGNTLTQRSMRTGQNTVTIQLDLSGLADGDCTGLCHFVSTQSASLGVVQNGSTRSLRYTNNRKVEPGPVIPGNDLWLRSTWGIDGQSQFAYSLDGNTFTPFGDPYQLAWAGYRGDRSGVYCYNNTAEAGFVDMKFFHYAYAGPPAHPH